MRLEVEDGSDSAESPEEVAILADVDPTARVVGAVDDGAGRDREDGHGDEAEAEVVEDGHEREGDEGLVAVHEALQPLQVVGRHLLADLVAGELEQDVGDAVLVPPEPAPHRVGDRLDGLVCVGRRHLGDDDLAVVPHEEEEVGRQVHQVSLRLQQVGGEVVVHVPFRQHVDAPRDGLEARVPVGAVIGGGRVDRGGGGIMGLGKGHCGLLDELQLMVVEHLALVRVTAD